jgi:hypothetical protein
MENLDLIINDEQPPIIEDVVNAILKKYRIDFIKETKQHQLVLDVKHQKILGAINKEKQQIIDCEKDIENLSHNLKTYKLQYLHQKFEIKTQSELFETDHEDNKRLIKIHNMKITEYNNLKFKIINNVEIEQHNFLKKKHEEDNKLCNEIKIFETEITRIKAKKKHIEEDLQKQLAVGIRDIESYSQKIENKQNIINILQGEISNIEKGSCHSRRQIIKNNKMYLIKNKNLQKLKKNIQYQIANINFEIYIYDQQRDNELNEINKQNREIEHQFRHDINIKNDRLVVLTKNANVRQNDAVNTNSKTWKTSYKKIVDEIDTAHTELTDAIQNFNNHLSKSNIHLNDINTKYKFMREIKVNAVEQNQNKLNQLIRSETNKVNKMSYQHQLNNQIAKEKMNLLNTEFNCLQQFQKNKYNVQRLAQKYENDMNDNINQLGKDLERSQERLKITGKRFLKVINKHRITTDKIQKNHQKDIDEIDKNISHCHDTLKKLENTFKHNSKKGKESKTELRHIRTDIKDTERIIKDKNKQLGTLKIRVERRLETMHQKENEVINEKIEYDLEYATKINLLDKIDGADTNQKIETLNNLMGTNIQF